MPQIFDFAYREPVRVRFNERLREFNDFHTPLQGLSQIHENGTV